MGAAILTLNKRAGYAQLLGRIVLANRNWQMNKISSYVPTSYLSGASLGTSINGCSYDSLLQGKALFRTGAMGAWHPWYFELLCNGTREFFRNFWLTVAWHPWNFETFNKWHPWIEIPKEGPLLVCNISWSVNDLTEQHYPLIIDIKWPKVTYFTLYNIVTLKFAANCQQLPDLLYGFILKQFWPFR